MIPPYTSYSMKILDDRTVLHAYNVKALGLRLAEIVEKKLEAGPDLAGHWDEVKDIFPAKQKLHHKNKQGLRHVTAMP